MRHPQFLRHFLSAFVLFHPHVDEDLVLVSKRSECFVVALLLEAALPPGFERQDLFAGVPLVQQDLVALFLAEVGSTGTSFLILFHVMHAVKVQRNLFQFSGQGVECQVMGYLSQPGPNRRLLWVIGVELLAGLHACIHGKIFTGLLGEPVPAPAVVGRDGLLRRIDAGEYLGLYLVRGKGVAGAGVFVFHRLLVLGFAEAAPCCSQIKKFRTGGMLSV